MTLHPDTFEYLSPTDKQKADMEALRQAAKSYAGILESFLPDGPDKTHTLRLFRTVAMWANVALTRGPEGNPRE